MKYFFDFQKKKEKKNLQGIQPSRTSKADIVPTGHDVHAEDLTTLVLPPAQFVHSDFPTKENVPAAHSIHLDIPE